MANTRPRNTSVVMANSTMAWPGAPRRNLRACTFLRLYLRSVADVAQLRSEVVERGANDLVERHQDRADDNDRDADRDRLLRNDVATLTVVQRSFEPRLQLGQFCDGPRFEPVH